MNQKDKEPLEFTIVNFENQPKIGANKMINPLALIPKQCIPSQANSNKPNHVFQGTFVNDYILAEDPLTKGKKIAKIDKKMHFKTRMCIHGRQCRRQLTCPYAHTENQLRKPFMKRRIVCKLYQMGKCHLGSVCREYHGNMDLMKKNYKYKAEICKDFLEDKCQKGNICIYIHQKPEEIQQEDQEKIEYIEVQQVNSIPQKNQQANLAERLPQPIPHSKKQIVQVVQQKIGEEQLVKDGLTFNFIFN